MKTVAIGDIHGHYDELDSLIDNLFLQHDEKLFDYHLVLCGDLVDSGPKSKEVLDFCIDSSKKYSDTFHPLRGNHDDMMITAYRHPDSYERDWWLTNYAGPTLASFGLDHIDDDILRPYVEYLESLPYYWENEDYFFVHGGLPPVSLSQIRKGVEEGDKELLEIILWVRGDFYNINYDWGKKIIFGHTAFNKPMSDEYEPYIKENMIGINTMPRNIGHLTAVVLPEEKFYTSK